MPAEFFALANAFLFALHNMFTKKGLRYSNPGTAVITSLAINLVFLWGVSLLFVPLKSLTSAGILIFVVVGLFQPGLTRLLTYKGIETLGVAITDPIRATTPLFSALVAMLLASILAGCSQVLRKVGLGTVPHPFLAAAVTASSSFAVSLLTLWISGRAKEIFRLDRKSIPFYLPAGIAVSLGMVAIYYALDLGKVTVVIPISSTGPFFSLVFSAIFLRDVERVTFKIVIGAGLIIAGVLLITLWK